jgi:ABC-type nitrate/sulfonate/bicarbonate transport system permease component
MASQQRVASRPEAAAQVFRAILSAFIPNEAIGLNKVGAGVAIGVALGVALGAAMGNVGAGIAIGIAIGAAVGVSQTKKS